MGPRKLFAILIALAVLIAPAFSRLGDASAALPDNHHMQMVQAGHCQSSEPVPDEHEQAPTKSCCFSMCLGVAVATPSGLQASNGATAPATYAIRSLHLSYLGEIATPPPKFV
jgi:hypothetical protein